EGRIDPGLREQFAFLRVADKRCGAALGREEGERIAIEGHDRRCETVLGCGGAQTLEHGAVARVETVELADRDGTRPEPGGNLSELREELHQTSTAIRERERERSQMMPSTGSTSGTNT